ncbi:MAG: hypothetical protein JWO53_1247 [Chlamydiia bacterium]|nr:hypothetical protein [Chlamydiia bacterium]
MDLSKINHTPFNFLEELDVQQKVRSVHGNKGVSAHVNLSLLDRIGAWFKKESFEAEFGGQKVVFGRKSMDEFLKRHSKLSGISDSEKTKLLSFTRLSEAFQRILDTKEVREILGSKKIENEDKQAQVKLAVYKKLENSPKINTGAVIGIKFTMKDLIKNLQAQQIPVSPTVQNLETRVIAITPKSDPHSPEMRLVAAVIESAAVNSLESPSQKALALRPLRPSPIMIPEESAGIPIKRLKQPTPKAVRENIPAPQENTVANRLKEVLSNEKEAQVKARLQATLEESRGAEQEKRAHSSSNSAPKASVQTAQRPAWINEKGSTTNKKMFNAQKSTMEAAFANNPVHLNVDNEFTIIKSLNTGVNINTSFRNNLKKLSNDQLARLEKIAQEQSWASKALQFIQGFRKDPGYYPGK